MGSVKSMRIETYTVSSLEKVFPDKKPDAAAIESGSALLGERYSYQLVCHLEDAERISVMASVSASPQLDVQIYEVGLVPVTFPVNSRHDDDYLRTAPGLYPDPLYPHQGDFSLPHNQWRSLWITTVIPRDCPFESAVISVVLFDADHPENIIAESEFKLDIIPAVLPIQKIIHTEWFHLDCLATYYDVPVFSEDHWQIIKNYMRNASDFGVNMILTPVLTPPLDTQIGKERPTVQLVEIAVEGNKYRFGFDKLKRYIDLAEECGIRYFEISHLFTQWGARHAPKVIAETKDGLQKIFGWETDAASKEYADFLNAFLKELRNWLAGYGKLERCYFHISDEPDQACFDSYRSARNAVECALDGCNIIDALSDYEYYEKGIIKTPVLSTDHIEAFLAHHVPNLWAYYCCAQSVDVSNLFLAMPSYRNRILGYQLYKYDIAGFLHWGYNFWYSQYSKKPVNPYIETGAINAFPAGDAFMVYPGADRNPIGSIHQYVQREAFQDLSALQLLETVLPKSKIIELIEKEGAVTFSAYPRDADWVLKKRKEVNALIAESVKFI